MIDKSKWIKKFENELDRKSIFCLYGNIDDEFFYENEMMNINQYLEQTFGNDMDTIFDEEYFEALIKETQDSANSLSTSLDFLKIVKEIKDSDKKYIVLKDARFLNLDCFSLRYFLEYVSSGNIKEKKIIIISENLGDFPDKLTSNNPYEISIYIDYPEEDERVEYVKEYLKFFREREKTQKPSKEIQEEFDIFIKMTAKRKLKEIRNIFMKAQTSALLFDEEKTMKDIINYYDIGEQDSPWVKLKKSSMKRLEERLKERVKGQEEAIDFVKKVVYRANLNLNGVTQAYSTKPMGVLFFTGPSGVGKTELAKALTECIFGDESAFKRFDMSEYKSPESINKLIGSDPGYVGYNEGGQLTNWIMSNPYSVILFDEIDKANIKIWDTFLQILEDGRLTDNKGNTGNFSESIIIFTSNIGNSEFDKKNYSTKEEAKQYYLNALHKYFEKVVGRVEILNRFGENKIVFNHIEEDVFQEIIEKKLKDTISNIQKRLKGVRIEIENLEEIQTFFMERLGEGTKFGARLVNSLIEEYFINEFASFYMEDEKISERVVVSIEHQNEGDKIKFQC